MEYVYKISAITREFYSRIFTLGRFKCIFFSVIYYSLNVLILAIKWYIITWLNYVKMLSFFFFFFSQVLLVHFWCSSTGTMICKWVVTAARGKQRLSWHPSHILNCMCRTTRDKQRLIWHPSHILHCAGRILKHWNEILPTEVFCRYAKSANKRAKISHWMGIARINITLL